ncbi:MAG TPA: hypothetical protein VFZ27_07530 [Terriglobia bacterium]|nr:hypothetical protein [Terriglobia bacterium]
MRASLTVAVVAILVSFPAMGQSSAQTASDQAAAVDLGQRAAIAALNFQQGDAAGFNRARDNFTPEGWKDFVQHMQGFLDKRGAPTFTSSFVAKRDATVLSESEGVLRLRIPGTLTQSNKTGRTTYRRAAIEVYVLRDPASGEKPIKIQHLEQITCAGASTACD